jgi:hypothetical protein
MNDLGVAGELVAAGSTDMGFRRYNGKQLLGDTKREVFERPDTRYVRGVMLPQWKVDEILRTRLRSFGVEVELTTEFISFSQSGVGNRDRLQLPAV